MGSPEKPNKSTKASIAPTTSPQSAAFQDSPIFNYINNLSPIKAVKGTSVIQGFPGLSSPPLVFTSPRINTHRQSIDLKRSQCHVSSHSESSQQDDTNKHITTRAVEPSQMSSELNLHNKQEHGNNSLRHDKTGSSSGCVDDYLTDLSEIVCANSSLKQFEDGPPEVADSVSPDASMERSDKEDDKGNIQQAKEDHEGNLSSHPKPAENDGNNQSNICQKVPSNISEGHISVQEYNQRIVQVSQSQLGKRRRLQFEEAQEITVENDPASPNPSNTLANSEIQDSSCADISSTPSNIQLTGSTQSTCPLSSSQNTRNASLTISKASGIGLHLNSIVNARPLRWAQNVSINPIDRSYLSAGGKKSLSLKRQCPSVSSNSNLVENVSAQSEEFMHVTPASYSNTNFVNVIEHQEKFDQESLSSEQAEKINELNRSNPKKKRKKIESTGDGCKRCNCKKTKCLKLYCDCFAAGIYCSDSCSCQGCFNKPEYEETVLETRQQIESRNPLAFAPKVIHRITRPPRSESGEDGDQVTPLAGRHKRGCNCKKSMCLKKYCECFQANVGCSDGCRCEGCQNMYGKKEVFGMSKEIGSMEAMNEKLNDSFDDKLKVGSIRPRSSLSEFHKPQNLTPQTPSFQRSDHGKDASKARLFHQRYLPSPESDCLFYPPSDSANYGMITETSNENLEIASLDQESNPHLEFMDEFSPGCPSSNNNTSRPQLLLPSFSSVSSLRFHGSPVTPVTLFGAKKPTESKQKYVDMIHDDTPNILKDSSTELNKVKVRSPNKKRVSPPKMRLHELGLSSLKSGRKFILKAVPSFPPLTPCIDLKDGTTGQNSNDPPGDNTL